MTCSLKKYVKKNKKDKMQNDALNLKDKRNIHNTYVFFGVIYAM